MKNEADLKNDTTWLPAARNADDWKKKDNTPSAQYQRLKLPFLNTRRQQQHHNVMKTQSSSSTWYEWLYDALWTAHFLRLACVIAVRRTPCAVCRTPHTGTTGPLTPSLREKVISRQFESLLQQDRICHLPFPFSVGDLAQISLYC